MICADNYFFPVQVDGRCRSESGSCICTAICPSRWTVPAWKCCPGVCLRSGSSPYLATDHTLYGLCLPFERGMGMSMPMAVPVLSGKFCGTCVSTAPSGPAAMSFTVSLAGSTIGATAAAVSTCSASADCTGSVAPMCSSGACVAMSVMVKVSLLLVLVMA